MLFFGKMNLKKNGTVYNIELQNGAKGASPKRARYHSGLIDMNILKAGKNFENLPENYSCILSQRVKELKERNYIEEGEGNTMSSYLERLKKQWKKEAVAEGHAEGRAESEARMAKLMGILAEEGRIADIKKASENEAYRKSLLQEFQLI